jgi:hypothetical protein
MARCRDVGSGLLLIAALGNLLLGALARPVPQLATPDYTLYHTK